MALFTARAWRTALWNGLGDGVGSLNGDELRRYSLSLLLPWCESLPPPRKYVLRPRLSWWHHRQWDAEFMLIDMVLSVAEMRMKTHEYTSQNRDQVWQESKRTSSSAGVSTSDSSI